jgi:hypothetical protein
MYCPGLECRCRCRCRYGIAGADEYRITEYRIQKYRVQNAEYMC